MTNLIFEKIAKTIEQIPTLPVVSKQIMSLLKDKNVSIKEIASVIEKDPFLTVRILRVANSPFYGTLSNVMTIEHALSVLGLAEVKAILLAFSVHNFFNSPEDQGSHRKNLWKHSLVCSQVAKYLVLYYKIDSDDSLFLASLIHDIGKVVFYEYFHDEFLQVVDMVKKHKMSFTQAEKQVTGVTHYQVAARILQMWRFPKQVIMPVYYHHAPWHDDTGSPSSIVIYLADMLTKLAGHACFESEPVPDIANFCGSSEGEFITKSGLEIDEENLGNILRHIQNTIHSDGKDILSIFEPERLQA